MPLLSWDDIIALLHQNMLGNYANAHPEDDITTYYDNEGNNLLMYAIKQNLWLPNALLPLPLLFFDANVKNHAGQTASMLLKAEQLSELEESLLCIDYNKIELRGLDALFEKIRQGDIEDPNDLSFFDNIDVSLLENGNARNRGGWNALMCAARYNRPNIMLALHIRFPLLDCNAVNKHEQTALMIASWHGYASCISILIDYFTSLNVNYHDSRHGNTALLLAAHNGQKESIIALARYSGPMDINHSNVLGQSALLLLAEGKHIDCLTALIESFPHISPWQTDTLGKTLLMYCATSIECLDVLHTWFPSYFEQIDINTTDNFGQTVLLHAIESFITDNEDFNENLLCDSTNQVNSSLRNDHRQKSITACFQALLRYFPNIDANFCDKQSISALTNALIHLDIDIITSLLTTFSTIDINIATDHHHEPSLIVLCQELDFPTIMQFLQTHFPALYNIIQPNIRSQTLHFTPLMITAASPTHTDNIHTLSLLPGIDCNVQDARTCTALALACQHLIADNINQLRICFDNNVHNINVNAIDMNKTPVIFHLLSSRQGTTADTCACLYELSRFRHINVNLPHIKSTPEYAVFLAMRHDDIFETFCRCFQLSIDHTVISASGKTILMQAISSSNHLRTIHKYFASSINPNQQTDQTVLTFALQRDDIKVETIELLLQLFPNINPNLTNHSGAHPLQLSLRKPQIFRFLVQTFHHFDIDLNLDSSNSCLSLACCRYAMSASDFSLLLQCPRSIDFEEKNSSDKSILMTIVSFLNLPSSRQIEQLQITLEHIAQLN